MSDAVGYTHDVFVSYSHVDRPWVADVLVTKLEAGGVRVLIDDRDFEPGASSIENMTKAVKAARQTLVVLTPEWVGSDWTQFEGLLTTQLDPSARERRLIPIMRKRCTPPEWVSYRSYLDFVDDGRCDQQMERLIRAVRRSHAGVAEAVKIDVVNEGLRTLADLIAGGTARDALLEFRFRFESIAGRIDRMASFKEVHDQLHHLQMHCYDAIVLEGPRIAQDDLAADALVQYADTLQQVIDCLRALDAQPVFAYARMTWIPTLERALDQLNAGIETRDAATVDRAAALIDRVLASEPARIDARLSDAASELELQAVIDAVSVVCRKAREAGLDAGKLNKLDQALEEMEHLDDTLVALVRSHAQWQDVDVTMRRVDTNMEADESELLDSWPEIKKQIAQLSAAAADWARNMSKQAASLDQAIKAKDRTAMLRHFRVYRKRAITRFFAVDTDLHHHCKELRRAGDPLAAIVQALA